MAVKTGEVRDVESLNKPDDSAHNAYNATTLKDADNLDEDGHIKRTGEGTMASTQQCCGFARGVLSFALVLYGQVASIPCLPHLSTQKKTFQSVTPITFPILFRGKPEMRIVKNCCLSLLTGGPLSSGQKKSVPVSNCLRMPQTKRFSDTVQVSYHL